MPSDESIESGTIGPAGMLWQLCTSPGGGEAKGMLGKIIKKRKRKNTVVQVPKLINEKKKKKKKIQKTKKKKKKK